MRDTNGHIATLNEEKAEILKEHFHSVFTTQDNNIPYFQLRTNKILDSIDFTEEKIRKHLHHIKEGKSIGPDDIQPKFLLEVADLITDPNVRMFNLSFNKMEFPSIWKMSNELHFLKKDLNRMLETITQLLLTCILCKIMEKIIRDKITTHLEENNLLTINQHGFRKGKSCITQLNETMEDWTRMIDENKSIDVAYLDFKMAFDTVSHKKLLRKLEGYGITGKLL